METVSDYINGTAWEDLTGEQILEFLEEHHISVSKLEAILINDERICVNRNYLNDIRDVLIRRNRL